MEFKSKLQNIYNQLISITLRFKSFNFTSLSKIPSDIDKIIVGDNKLKIYSSISPIKIVADDLRDVITIGDFAFYNCDSLTKVTIPDSVTTIGDFAFDDCDNLTEVIIPDSVTTIGDRAFNSCNSLTEVTIPDSVTTIGESVFYNCNGLTKITVGDSVTTISDHAFYFCSNLTEVTIGNSVTIIGDYAFYHCNSLTKITIPDNVTTIGASAFNQCYSLTDIYLKPITPPSLGHTSAIPTTTTIHVPIGSGDAYRSATNWSSFADKIIEDIEI